MENNVKRTHRVGSVTAGLSLICFGALFIAHMLGYFSDVTMIARLIPAIMIGLGIEVLLSNRAKGNFVYDKGAIALMFVMALMVLAECGAIEVMDYIKAAV